ncbi:MAG: hypothetical protein D6729_18085 [Deltaproteobacteria bacterium]|nr:MAG: hypothetical protein D6729_18085 [Deltaproteobacteria bacterium]
MIRHPHWRPAALTVALFTALFTSSGCFFGGGTDSVIDTFEPAKVDDAEDAEKLAGLSAPNLYFTGMSPLFFVELAASLPEKDPNCPVVEEDGDTTTYSGECTTQSGTEVFGRATVVKTGEFGIDSGSLSGSVPIGTFTYEGFGYRASQSCDDGSKKEVELRFDGRLESKETGSGAYAFAIDLLGKGDLLDSKTCTLTPDGTLALVYSGTFSGEKPNGEGQYQKTTWNGSGRLGQTDLGRASATTHDEVVDATVCGYEALSGSTQISAAKEVLVTYDGESDCSMDATVKWSLDGAEQGELKGVSCATGGGSASAAALLFVLAGLRIRRRR